MTTGAIIAIDQDRPGPSVSAGSPGVARNDIWLGHDVHLRCTTSTNPGGYEWTLLDKPPSSTATLANTTTPVCTLAPDVGGSYRVKLETNGGGPGNVQILIVGVTKDSAGATILRGWRIPAFGESPGEDNFAGQLRGWAEALETILNDIRTNGFIGGGAPTGAAGGSLAGTYPNPTVKQLDGAAGVANILATTTILAEGSVAPVTTTVATLTTTDGSGHLITFYSLPNSSVVDIRVTTVGRNNGGTGGTPGDVYRADVRGLVKRVGAANAVLIGGTPTPTGIVNDADLGGCSTDLGVSGASIVSSVTGIVGRTIDWTVTIQIQERH